MSPPVHPVTAIWKGSCPAKINLRLAVVGRRADGFHDLISLVSRVALADELELRWQAEGSGETLEIEGGELAATEDNLVLRAVRAFRAAAPFPGRVHGRLLKRIPVGAGLGGGSSDAAATLRGLSAMWGEPLPAARLHQLAAGLGADVPFFLGDSPAILRDIGERIEPVPEWGEALREPRVALFRPFFGISTPWAYGALAAAKLYSAAAEEEALYAFWRSRGLEWESLPRNDFRSIVDRRYPTVPVLLRDLNQLPGVRAEMTGSGSACFALCASAEALESVRERVRRAWGPDAFWRATRAL